MLNKSALSFLTAFALSATAYGQDVSSTKESGNILDVISSQSANVQLRNYWEAEVGKTDRDKIGGEMVTTQVRGNFTLNAFNDKLSNTLTLGASSKTDRTNQVKQRSPEFVSELTAFDSDYFSLTPNLYVVAPQDGSGDTNGSIGLRPSLKHPAVNLGGIAMLSSSFTIDADAQFSSSKKDAAVRSEVSDEQAAGLGLTVTANEKTDDKTITAKGKQGVTYEIMYTPSVALDFSQVVKGLDVEVFVENVNTYEPVLEVDGDSTKTVYQPDRNTDTYFRVGYAINETLKFDNFFWRSDKGLWEARGNTDGNKYTNLARLSYTIY